MAARPSKNSKITILLAEDEAPLRNLLQTIFEKAGFTVLAAENGQQAAHLADGHEGAIDLLVSNVQMPHMTGPDLAKSLMQMRPGLRVLLISAYPQGLLMLDNGWSFLQKPFLPKAIVDKIYTMMASPPGQGATRVKQCLR